MGSRLGRVGEALRRLLADGSYDSARRIDKRPHRTLLAAAAVLLVLPGATSAAELPVIGSGVVLPGWASTAELRYGNGGDEERPEGSDRDQGDAARQNAPEERKERALARERPRERFMGEQPANLTE